MTTGWTDFVDPPSDPFDLTKMPGASPLPIDYDVLNALADPQFGLATTPKASDRAQSAVDGFAGAVTHGLTGIVGTVSDLIANLSATAAFGPDTIGSLISALTRGGQSGSTPAQLEPVVAGFENRVTVLEGGAVTEWLVTSSTTLDLSAYIDYDVVLIGASQPGQAGSSSGFGGSSPGGTHGGFIRAQGKVADLPDPTAVSLVIGTNSGRSIFGANADGTDGTLKTVPGKAASANGPVFDPTESAPGSGGYGGQGGRASTNNSSGQGATDGGDGESSVTSIGGAGGALGKGGAWGGNGESSNVQGSGAKAGGAGGGGGGGGNYDNLSYPGGQGGNGGYPGGGPGGGGMGGKGSLQGPASGGGPGATANGFAFVRATGLVTP